MMEKTMSLFGKDLQVKDRIPYKDKLEAANKLASMMGVFDDVHGIAYISYMEDAAKWYVRLAYYTDMDVAEYEEYDKLIELMDMIEESDISEFEEFIKSDFDVVEDLAYTLFSNAERIFKREHSVEYNIMKSFGFLFDGQDITQTIAQARDVNAQMIDHLGAIMSIKTKEEENKPIDMSQFAKKNK